MRDELKGMRELHLFAGCGGGILGGILLGHRPICAVEIVEYRRKVLLQRQRDGVFPKFPIWDDVRTFDGRPWKEQVDIVAGGFPCQDISPSGKRAGIHGPKSGLWKHMARIIREVEPPFVFVENSATLTVRGLGVVLGDLAEMGFDAKWGVLGAADAIWLAGTPVFDHLRLRIFIKATHPEHTRSRGVSTDEHQRQRQEIRWSQQPWRNGRTEQVATAIADSDSLRELQSQGSIGNERGWTRDSTSAPAHTNGSGSFNSETATENAVHGKWDYATLEQTRRRISMQFTNTNHGGWWSAEPGVGRVVHGMANRNDRLAATGDGQVPAVVALAWRTLTTHGPRSV